MLAYLKILVDKPLSTHYVSMNQVYSNAASAEIPNYYLKFSLSRFGCVLPKTYYLDTTNQSAV